MSLTQSLKMEQKLVLAPQIIHSIEILQLPIMDLRERIEQEITENPLLEIAEALQQPEEELEEHAVKQEPRQKSEFARIDEIADDYNDYYSMTSIRRGPEDAPDRKAEAIMNTPAKSISLQDYLFTQLRMLDLPPEKLAAGENIIYNIDDNGYLQYPLAELIPDENKDALLSLYEEVLAVIQTFDPPGVGARDLKECLLLQLRGNREKYELEVELIKDHLHNIERNKFPLISKKTGRTIEEVKEAVKMIASLNPKPGLLFTSESSCFVKPDIIVEEIDGRFQVFFDDSTIPPLRISTGYRDILNDMSAAADAKNYVKSKLESAQWLIEAIRQRRETLTRVSTAIVQYQEEFLRKGLEFLKPLKMQEIADRIGVHVSTVSRAIAGKYMQTPRGIFPIKYFFTGGTRDARGGEASWKSIQQRIKDVIAKENRKNPLSDDAIASILSGEGFDVARRTVTKYRKAMRIPSSRQRKEY